MMTNQRMIISEAVDIHVPEDNEVVGRVVVQASIGNTNSVLLKFNLGPLGQAAIRMTPEDARRIGVLLCNAASDAGEGAA